MITLAHYLWASGILFAIGVLGVVSRRNALMILLSLEIMLNAANLSFVAFSKQLGNLVGQIFVFFVMTVAAAEVAVGLAIILVMVKDRKTANADELKMLRW